MEKIEPVAWGHPNTAITGRKQALMMVELEIPSNAQYPELWVPLYTTPPSVEAAIEAKDKEIAAKQAEIDRLMWEFCPQEMTPEQVANWEAHQQPWSDK